MMLLDTYIDPINFLRASFSLKGYLNILDDYKFTCRKSDNLAATRLKSGACQIVRVIARLKSGSLIDQDPGQ